jgi:hypothetical protein
VRGCGSARADGRWGNNHVTLIYCGEGNDLPPKAETNTEKVINAKMKERNRWWRERANAIGKNASILAGGDGSRKSRNGETIAANGWGALIYDIGEHSVEYWTKQA